MMYPNLQEAFLGELRRLLETGHTADPIRDPNSPASEFGTNPQDSVELLGTSFQVHDISSNIVTFPSRSFNLRYGVGQLLWTLAGSDDPDWIEYYRGKRSHQKKAAFGNRLLKNRGSINQCEITLRRILDDPGTRRTYMPIFSVDDHAFPEGEVPCAAGFQVFLRADRLHGVAVMRAQNAINSLPMDLFIFTSLLQFLASDLGREVGSYLHMCATFHLFKRDAPIGHHVLHEPAELQCVSLGEGCAHELADLLVFEREIRMAGDEGKLLHVPNVKFHTEWGQNVQRILTAIALEKSGRGDMISTLGIPSALLKLLVATAPAPTLQPSDTYL